jgi:hypothetical protein
MDGAGGTGCEGVLREDVEGGVVVRLTAGRKPGGGEDGFEFSGADYSVYFGDVLLDLVAVALDETAGDDDALGFSSVGAADFVLDHLEDSVDGLLLGGVDEAAGVDDDDLGVFGSGGEFGSVVMEEAHHDLGVDEVFGAAEGDEAYFGAYQCGGFDYFSFGCCRRSHSLLVYQFCGVEALIGGA